MKAVSLFVLAACIASLCRAGGSADAVASAASKPSASEALAVQLAAAAGAVVTCSAVSAKPAAVVCALAEDKAETKPPRVACFSVLFATDDAMVAALLRDVTGQTISPSTELLVGLVTGFYSDETVAQLGREMARRKLHALKVVLWNEDLGLYGCWSYLCAHVAVAEYRVRPCEHTRSALNLL